MSCLPLSLSLKKINSAWLPRVADHLIPNQIPVLVDSAEIHCFQVIDIEIVADRYLEEASAHDFLFLHLLKNVRCAAECRPNCP